MIVNLLKLARKGWTGLLITALLFTGTPAVMAQETAEATDATRQVKKIALAGSDLSAHGQEIQSILKSRLATEPYEIVEYTGLDLADRNKISAEAIDLLIWSGAETYPVEAIASVTAYLKEGGDLVALGAPPFEKATMQIGGVWRTKEEVDAELKLQQPELFMDYESPEQRTGWTRSTNDPSVAGSLTFTQENGSTVMNYYTSNFTSYDTYLHPMAPSTSEGKAILFQARGSEQTRRLVFEIKEQDNSRWIAATDLTSEWKTYILRPQDFRCWSCSSLNRGFPNDYVHFTQAKSINLGLATSHANLDPGEHRFSIDGIGWVQDPLAGSELSVFEVMDGLTPQWKYFPVGDFSTVRASAHQSFLPQVGSLTPDRMDGSTYPRPLGTGINKQRTSRFIPLLETYDAAGNRSGYLAWMTVNSGMNAQFNRNNPAVQDYNPYSGSVWTVFSVSDPDSYRQPELLEAVAGTVKRMLSDPYLLEGGTDQFAYFAGANQVKLGASVAHFQGAAEDGLEVEWRVTGPDGALVYGQRRSLEEFTLVSGKPGGLYSKSELVWGAPLASGTYKVETKLLRNGVMVDRLEHEMNVWESQPLESRRYVTADQGRFMLDGKPWFAYGINYMPVSGLAQENGQIYEFFFSRPSYDPVHFDEDLKRIKELGFNAVSVFIYYDDLESMNLLDFLVRAEKYGLKVNLAIKNIGAPRGFSASQVKDILTTYRLAENDALFAYDIAWEQEWGMYAPGAAGSFNSYGRVLYDSDWERWVKEQYGSIAAAEEDWGVPIPVKGADRLVTGPSDAQLKSDGPHRRMVAAYRRFADDFTARMHEDVASTLKAMDPHHLVSFRMNLSGDPTAPPERMPYDFKGLATSMDFMGPEAYGRKLGGDILTAGMFTADYSRYAAPGKPVMWTEAGYSVWDRDAQTYYKDNTSFLLKQKSYYEQFSDMLHRSDVNGVAFWWYAGGYRYNENSDYGILNPDGSERPVTQVVRQYAELLKNKAGAPSQPRQQVEMMIDREQFSTGLKSIYEQLKEPYEEAVRNGIDPVLTDEGRATTSADTPLLAVGNTPYNGSNPPKYLNALFKRAQISTGDGSWLDVSDGMRVTLPEGSKVLFRTRIANTGSATWLSPRLHEHVTGSVYLASTAGSDIEAMVPIRVDTAYMEDTQIGETLLADRLTGPTDIALRMTASQRMSFGEVLEFTVEPGEVDVPHVTLTVVSGGSLNGWSGTNTSIQADLTGDVPSLSGTYSSGSPAQIMFVKRFPARFNTGATGDTGTNQSNGILELDLYISDVSKITSSTRIQFSSLQVDRNEFVWEIRKLVPGLKNGWNRLSLPIAKARVNGDSDPGSLKVIRVLAPLATPVSGTQTVMKLANISLSNHASLLPKDPSWLRSVIRRAEQLDPAAYTDAMRETIGRALAQAKQVSGQPGATQSAMDEAAAALEEALFPVRVKEVVLPDGPVVLNSETGAGYTLPVVVRPSDAADPGLRWTSSHPEVVTADSSGTLTAHADGTALITAVSLDGGLQATQQVIVDRTAPDITWEVTASTNGGQSRGVTVTDSVYWSEAIAIRIAVTDSGLGLSQAEAYLDGKAITFTEDIEPLSLPLGVHTLQVTAVDRAGNEASRVLTFGVTMDAEHLADALVYARDRGWITDDGILESLLAKVDRLVKLTGMEKETGIEKESGIEKDKDKDKDKGKGTPPVWQALEQELEAQSGIHIAEEFARLLTEELLPILKGAGPYE